MSMKNSVVALLALSACFNSFSTRAAENIPSWLVGRWTVVFDEDGTPPDFADFTANGKYINRGFDCGVRAEMPFHTAEIPKKGPIALVFRPSQDKKKLTYTSPRTRHNAVMQKVAGNKCGK
jgi:hypothetical protein